MSSIVSTNTFAPIDPDAQVPSMDQKDAGETVSVPPSSPPPDPENAPTRAATPPKAAPTAGSKRPLPETPSAGAEVAERLAVRSHDQAAANEERVLRRSSRQAARTSGTSSAAATLSPAAATPAAAQANLPAATMTTPAAPQALPHPATSAPARAEKTPRANVQPVGNAAIAAAMRPTANHDGTYAGAVQYRPTAQERAADIKAQYHGLVGGPDRELGSYPIPARAFPVLQAPGLTNNSGQTSGNNPRVQQNGTAPASVPLPQSRARTVSTAPSSQSKEDIERDRQFAAAVSLAYEAGASTSIRPFEDSDEDDSDSDDAMEYTMDASPLASPTVDHVRRRASRSAATRSVASRPASARETRSPIRASSSMGGYSSSEDMGPEVFDPAAGPLDSSDDELDEEEPAPAPPAPAPRGRRRGGLTVPAPATIPEAERKRMIKLNASLVQTAILFFGSGPYSIEGMLRNAIWTYVDREQRDYFRKSQDYHLILRFHVPVGSPSPDPAAVADLIVALIHLLWPNGKVQDDLNPIVTLLQAAANAAGLPAALAFVLSNIRKYVYDTFKIHRAITIGGYGFIVHRINEPISSSFMYAIDGLPDHAGVIVWLYAALPAAWPSSAKVQALAKHSPDLHPHMTHIDALEASLVITVTEVNHRGSNIPTKQYNVYVDPLSHSAAAVLEQRMALSEIVVKHPMFGTAAATDKEWDCTACTGINHPAGICFAEKVTGWPLGTNSHRGITAPPTATSASGSNTTTTQSANPRVPAPRQHVPHTGRPSRGPPQDPARTGQSSRGRSGPRLSRGGHSSTRGGRGGRGGARGGY